MAIKNSVSNNLLSAFVGSINVFNCHLPGMVSLANCYHFHCLTLRKGHFHFSNFLHAEYYLITNKCMGLDMRKPVFRFCNQQRCRSALSAPLLFVYSSGFAINKGADQGCQRLCLFFRVCDQQRRRSGLSAPLLIL